ncbi:hypothetical protein MnTg02_02985 [bacterium MnTg02]|nr:hypothetical protein MnTg02_02985 [bacterium MnTg02]
MDRRRACFLQMIGANVDRIPFRQLFISELDHVGDQPHGRVRWKSVGAAGEIFLDDVVLDRPCQRLAVHALLIGNGDIERQKPRRRGVDGHRRIHLLKRDAFEKRPHVPEVRDRNTDLANFAARQRMVGIITGLRRQIEGDRKTGLTLFEIAPVKRVRGFRRRMARIGANEPGAVLFSRLRCHGFAYLPQFLALYYHCSTLHRRRAAQIWQIIPPPSSSLFRWQRRNSPASHQ